jgi:hypothetical protein
MTTHLQHKEKHHMTLLKPILSSTLLILGCAFASAQNSASEPDANSDASYNYNFQSVNFFFPPLRFRVVHQDAPQHPRSERVEMHSIVRDTSE